MCQGGKSAIDWPCRECAKLLYSPVRSTEAIAGIPPPAESKCVATKQVQEKQNRGNRMQVGDRIMMRTCGESDEGWGGWVWG